VSTDQRRGIEGLVWDPNKDQEVQLRPSAGPVPLHDMPSAEAAQACHGTLPTTLGARVGYARLPLTGATGHSANPGTLGTPLEQAVSKGLNRIGAAMSRLRGCGAYGRGLEDGGDRREVVLRPNDARERIISVRRGREDSHGSTRVVHGWLPSLLTASKIPVPLSGCPAACCVQALSRSE